jgi:hypothetical protein
LAGKVFIFPEIKIKIFERFNFEFFFDLRMSDPVNEFFVDAVCQFFSQFFLHISSSEKKRNPFFQSISFY